MKTLLFIFLTGVSSQIVQAYRGQPSAEKINFSYHSQDGLITLDCTSMPLKKDSPTYQIHCGKGTEFLKVFTAQFYLRRILGPPRPSYELVFRISRSHGDPSAGGSRAWLTLDRGFLHDVALHQEVEEGAGVLVAHYSAGL